MKRPPIIRNADSRDLGFVIGSWRDSFKQSKWAGVIPNNLYDDVMKELITGLLARGSSVAVALNPADINHLIGFICWERPAGFHYPILHYIYIISAWRGTGLAQTMLLEAGIAPGRRFYCTARTDDGRKVTGGIFDPRIARRKDPPRVAGIGVPKIVKKEQS
jgi:hypothetical protein